MVGNVRMDSSLGRVGCLVGPFLLRFVAVSLGTVQGRHVKNYRGIVCNMSPRGAFSGLWGNPVGFSFLFA